LLSRCGVARVEGHGNSRVEGSGQLQPAHGNVGQASLSPRPLLPSSPRSAVIPTLGDDRPGASMDVDSFGGRPLGWRFVWEGGVM